MFHKITPRVPGLDRLWTVPQGTVQIGPPFVAGGNQTQGGGTYPATRSVSLDSPATLMVAATQNWHGTGNPIALVVVGAPGQRSAEIVGPNVTGKSYGLFIRAGTNSSDQPLLVSNWSINNLLAINGDGSGVLGYNGTANTLTWTATGNVTIAAPASGNTLDLSGLNTANVILCHSTGAQAGMGIGWDIAISSTAWNIYSQGTDALALGAVGSGNCLIGTSTGSFQIFTNANTRVTVNSAGNVTIAAPTSGTTAGLTVSGIASANIPAVQINGANFAGARGLQVFGGTTGSSDVCFLCNDAPSTVNLFQVVNTPAIQGRGPNAAALVDMTPDTGTFTGTLTGYASNLSPSCAWARMGNLVCLWIASTTGTSNATTMTLTGLPAAIQPARAFSQGVILEDSGSVIWGTASFAAASGTITFGKAIGFTGGFTASGTKGVPDNTIIVYLLF